MGDVKAWLSSKTLWGAIVTIVAPLLGLIGISLSADDQAYLVNTATGMINLIFTGVTIIGGVVAFVGRLRANKRIGGVVTPDPAKAPPPTPPRI
jgi:uncharacterized membrane protein